ncbi:hypothetical protein BZA77DRAFT_7318 [Pyronema omphalodes]|nr:hypothetical protein BZA77DRAFT_7318 [Pyronema omphalodes]
MNCSLPLVTPRDSHSLWYTPTSTYSFAPAPTLPYNNNHRSQHPEGGPTLAGQNRDTRPKNAGLSALQQLELDEANVAARKLHIQRFGCTWIRPPGMAKTYQGELDEKAEREEAEAQEMLEDVDLPLDGTFDEGEDTAHDNRDLDVDIPEAIDGSDLDGDIQTEADSFIGEEEDLDGDEVDLDADIPEGEAETLWDESEEEEEDDDDEEEEEEEAEEAEISCSEVEEGSEIEGGAGYASASHEHSTEPDSISHDGFDAEISNHQVAFSHDERYPTAFEQGRWGFDWRARERYFRNRAEYEMEVESD